MPPFVPEFIKGTLALIGVAWLGAVGVIDGVEVTDRGLIAQTTFVPSVAFGDVVFLGNQPHLQDRAHESGHLYHEDELGVLYLPLAIVGSLVGYGRYQRSGDPMDYFSVWTEREADRLGGVTR